MARELVCTCDLCGKRIYSTVYNIAYIKTSVDNPEDVETYEFDDRTSNEFVNPDICYDCYHNYIMPAISRDIAGKNLDLGIIMETGKNTGSEKCNRSKITEADVKIMVELKAEGLSNKKISEQIGCSEQTVANYLAKQPAWLLKEGDK